MTKINKEGWEIKKLGEVAKIRSGKSIAASKIYDTFDEGLFPCYGGNGIRGFVEEFSHEGIFPIIGRVGALCGNVHLAQDKFYATEHALVVELAEKDVVPQWLTHLLSHYKLRKYAKGVAQPVLSAGELSRISIPLPPLPIQQRIVEELDEINAIISAKKQQLSKLDELAQSIFYNMFGDPVANEKGWEMKKLGDLAREIGDGLHGTPEYTNANTQCYFINGNNLEDGRIAIKETTKMVSEITKAKHFVDLDDFTILVSINGTLGKTAFYRGENVILGKSACYIKLKNDVNKKYIYEILKGDYFKKYAIDECTGTTIRNVSLKSMRKFPIPLPPLPLQEAFAARVSAIEEEKSAIVASIEKIQTLLDARMQEYFG